MAEIPQTRKSKDELLEIQRKLAPQPLNPTAATAKVPTAQDLPLSVGNWLLTIIVLAIPILNIILYIYWAFISKGNVSRINFCRASLILAALTLVLALVFQVGFG
jgi:hypothetical protein